MATKAMGSRPNRWRNDSEASRSGATASCTYNPNAGFAGADSNTYTICLAATNTAICDNATVNEVVGPNADDDVTSTAQNTPVSASDAGNEATFSAARAAFEKNYLPKARQQNGGNQRHTAEQLGIGYSTVKTKVRAYGLSPEAGGDDD